MRSLDKHLAKIARARAKQIAFDEAFAPEITKKDVEKILGMPKFLNEEYEVGGMTGVVTGLAWTEVGGDILYIESVPDARQGQDQPDGQPGRRDEGVGDDRPRVGHGPLQELGIDPEAVRNERHQHPRSGGRHPEATARRPASRW